VPLVRSEIPSFARAARLAALGLTLLATARLARAQTTWSVQLFGGSAYSFHTPLTIRQTGQPEMRLTAHYSTRPWSGALYYAYRFGRWSRSAAWELELVHHKVYLENPPPEVQHFEVTHGYNLIFLNRALRRYGFIFRLGAGVVIARPESVIRTLARSEDRGLFRAGYYFTGPSGQLAVERRFTLWRGLFASAEGKLSAARARMSVPGGQATVPNVALHGLLGLGYMF
jgi:hypothetical protein